jgi:hypothetical protein
MSSRLAGLLLFAAVLPLSAAAQAVPTYPGDSITARARPAHPVYVSPGPIAPTLPGDTLLGGALSVQAAVPLSPVAPTMPGDVITQPPQWVLDTLRADSIRQGLVAPDSLPSEPDSAPGYRVLPDSPERADSLRAEPGGATRERRETPRRSRRDDGIRRS